MKVIIAGSRTITDIGIVAMAVIESGFQIDEVVSGGARGVDRLGELWAERWRIPVKRFPADWNKFGKSAGPIRNKEMGDYADALIAVWDCKSSGTGHMIGYATGKGLKVYVKKVPG
jgi:hypothetical protein